MKFKEVDVDKMTYGLIYKITSMPSNIELEHVSKRNISPDLTMSVVGRFSNTEWISTGENSSYSNNLREKKVFDCSEKFFSQKVSVNAESIVKVEEMINETK